MAQADVLDQTVAFLAKRDGIDKVGISLQAPSWAPAARPAPAGAGTAWAASRALCKLWAAARGRVQLAPSARPATAGALAAGSRRRPGGRASTPPAAAVLHHSASTSLPPCPLNQQTLKIIRYTTRLLLSTALAGSSHDLAARLKAFEASIGTSRKGAHMPCWLAAWLQHGCLAGRPAGWRHALQLPASGSRTAACCVPCAAPCPCCLLDAAARLGGVNALQL